MTPVKSEKEIAAARESGRILGLILHELQKAVTPGVSTLDLENLAEKLFRQHQVKPGFKGYHGYPAILCTSVNEQVVHAIPSAKPLNEGDILSIDCGVIIDGLNSDSAVAIAVGQNVTPLAQKMVDTCIEALWAGIGQVKHLCRVGDISAAIEQVITREGFNVVKELTGHGIGYGLHERPYICNYGKAGTGEVLRAGMTIAIEPIFAAGKSSIETLEDDWTIVTCDGSLAIQHEHTVLITETGCEVLSLRPGEIPFSLR